MKKEYTVHWTLSIPMETKVKATSKDDAYDAFYEEEVFTKQFETDVMNTLQTTKFNELNWDIEEVEEPE